MNKDQQFIFQHLTHGVYVISVVDEKSKNAFTAAWVMQVSFDPLLVSFSINPKNHSYKMLKETGVCCISVLDNKDMILADHFGRSSDGDKMAGYEWLDTLSGAPALAQSLAYFSCHVDHYTDAGDHELAICKVADAVFLNKGRPMLYRETEDMDNSSDLFKK